MSDRKIGRWTGAYLLVWSIIVWLAAIFILLLKIAYILDDIRAAVQ